VGSCAWQAVARGGIWGGMEGVLRYCARYCTCLGIYSLPHGLSLLVFE